MRCNVFDPTNHYSAIKESNLFLSLSLVECSYNYWSSLVVVVVQIIGLAQPCSLTCSTINIIITQLKQVTKICV